MLNGKQYLQICDMNIFEVHICFHSIVILLEVVEHEFLSVWCDPREIRGNWGDVCWFSCGKTCIRLICKNKRIKSPLFWILCIYLCSWTSLKCLVPFFRVRCKRPHIFDFKRKSAFHGYTSEATPLFPLWVCDVLCYQHGNFQQCGNNLSYQHQSQLWLIVTPLVDFTAGGKKRR